MATSDLSFGQQLWLQIAGPLVSTVVGSLIIGGLVAWITTRAQNRRADRQIRDGLIEGMTRVSATLYIEAQAYARFLLGLSGSPETDATRAKMRKGLDDAYEKAVIEGTSLEARLEAYFADPQPREDWHGARDCLAVRYFDLVLTDHRDKLEEILKVNAADYEGKPHSGLSLDDLHSRAKVLARYQQLLSAATVGVTSAKMRA
jgi:hypothetical protein